MKKIAVFAGNECVKEKESYYFSLAYNTGKFLAKNGYITITGGGPGLMNQVMKGAYENGGETIAVCLMVPGRENTAYASKKFLYHSLNPRQQKILSLGEGFIALPGGIGTLSEIADVLALKRKREISQQQPLILLDSYYREFAALAEHMEKEGFVDEAFSSLYEVVDSPESAIKILKEGSREYGI